MDPMQLLAALGDRGLFMVTASIGFYAWGVTWWEGDGFLMLLFNIVYYYLTVICSLLSIGVIFLLYMWLSSLQNSKGHCDWSKYIKISDPDFEKDYGDNVPDNKIPIELLIEAYMDEKLDFKGDVYEIFLNHRYDFMRMCFTWNHLPFILKRFLPVVLTHTQENDKREVQEVYDRGNDFYHWFLGESMLYTSGVFESDQDTVEQAQINKMNLACRKVFLQEGDRLLDIGCGWGTFACHAAREFGAQVTGITISEEGAKFAKKQSQDKNVADKVDIKCIDYRDIPRQTWKCITCFEMAEHVGVKNFQGFMSLVYDRLDDEGLFMLQIAGLRREWQYEDLLWGLFMNKYIFPGADASCPLAWYIEQAERAGFEVRTVETIGIHYSSTLKSWYDIWEGNKEKVIAKYGVYWFRMWSVFLAWSTIASGQGSATCYQILLHKNTSQFNRKMFIGHRV